MYDVIEKETSVICVKFEINDKYKNDFKRRLLGYFAKHILWYIYIPIKVIYYTLSIITS